LACLNLATDPFPWSVVDVAFVRKLFAWLFRASCPICSAARKLFIGIVCPQWLFGVKGGYAAPCSDPIPIIKSPHLVSYAAQPRFDS